MSEQQNGLNFDAFDISSSSSSSSPVKEPKVVKKEPKVVKKEKQVVKKEPKTIKKEPKVVKKSETDELLQELFTQAQEIRNGINEETIVPPDNWKDCISTLGVYMLKDALGTEQEQNERLQQLCSNAAECMLSLPEEYETFVPKLNKLNYIGSICYKDGQLHGFPMVQKSALELDMALLEPIFDGFVPEKHVIGWTPGPFLANTSDSKTGVWQSIEGSKNGLLDHLSSTSPSVVALVALTKCDITFFPHTQEDASKWAQVTRASSFKIKKVQKALFDAVQESGLNIPLEPGTVIITHNCMPLLVNGQDQFACKVIPVEWVESGSKKEIKRNKAVFNAVSTGQWKLADFGLHYNHLQLPKADNTEEYETLKGHFPLPDESFLEQVGFSKLKDPFTVKLEEYREKHKRLLERIAVLDNRLWKTSDSSIDSKAAQDWEALSSGTKPKNEQNIKRYQSKLASLAKAVEHAEQETVKLNTLLEKIDTALAKAESIYNDMEQYSESKQKFVKTTLTKLRELRDADNLLKRESAIEKQLSRIEKHEQDLEEQKNKKKSVQKRKHSNSSGDEQNDPENQMENPYETFKKELMQKVYYSADTKYESQEVDYEELDSILSDIKSCTGDWRTAVMAGEIVSKSAGDAFTRLNSVFKEFTSVLKRDKSSHDGKHYNVGELKALRDVMNAVFDDVKILRKKPNIVAGGANGEKKHKSGSSKRITCEGCGTTQHEFEKTGLCKKCYIDEHGEDMMQYVNECYKLAKRLVEKEEEEHKQHVKQAQDNDESVSEYEPSTLAVNFQRYKDEVEDELVREWDRFVDGKTRSLDKFQKWLQLAKELLPNINEDEEFAPGEDDEDDEEYNSENNKYGQIVSDNESLGQESFSSSEEEFEVVEKRKRNKKRGRPEGTELADEVLKALARVPIENIRINLIQLYNEQKLDEVRSALKKLPKSAYRIQMLFPHNFVYHPMMFQTEEEAKRMAKTLSVECEIEETKL